MDYKEMDFDPSYAEDYKPCLNETFVRIDRICCYCSLHECFVSKNQSKRRNCNDCKHKINKYKFFPESDFFE